MTNFKRNIVVSESKKLTTNKTHIIGKIVIAIVILFALLYTLFQLILISNNIINHWQELQFAYEKPTVVQTVRIEYQKQQNKMDQSFAKPQDDKTQALLEEISNTLKSK